MGVLIGRGGGVQTPVFTALGTVNDGGVGAIDVTNMTITNNVAVGDMLFIAHAWTGIAGDTCIFSDSGGNVYPSVSDMDKGSTASSVAISYTMIPVTVALTSGASQLTSTLNASRSGRILGAFKMTRTGIIPPASPWDGSSSATGTSVTMAPGNITSTQIPDLAVGVFNNSLGGVGSTPGGYTSQISATTFAGTTGRLQVFTRLTSSILILNATSTITSATWVAGQTAYRCDDSYPRSARFIGNSVSNSAVR
jgi:hypothetical protein